MMEQAKGFGYGRWPRAQLYAIVHNYRRNGRDPQWVARKLGISEKLTATIFDAGVLQEDAERLAAELDGAFDGAVGIPS